MALPEALNEVFVHTKATTLAFLEDRPRTVYESAGISKLDPDNYPYGKSPEPV